MFLYVTAICCIFLPVPIVLDKVIHWSIRHVDIMMEANDSKLEVQYCSFGIKDLKGYATATKSALLGVSGLRLH